MSAKYELGHLPNKRGGFDHIHSGMTECGMAYHDALMDELWMCRARSLSTTKDDVATRTTRPSDRRPAVLE